MYEIKATDVKIFSHRRLKPTTTWKILNSLLDMKCILKILINGESLPKVVGYGPAKGTIVNHRDRKIITIKGKELELFVSVGEIIVSVDHEKLEVFLNRLDNLLNEALDFKYDVSVGIFTRIDSTVSDYLKVGYGIEKNIDLRMIGLTDPKTNSKDVIKLIGD